MTNILEIERVCIILGLNCNLKCKYCLNKKSKRNFIPNKISNQFINFLLNLKSEICEAVCFTGGESLLYLDNIKDIIQYIPKDINKRIITNGILIDKNFVDFVNSNNIEVVLSHDGEKTKFLRGIDVLKDKKILKFLQEINILRISSVITKYNTNIIENLTYTKNLIQREDLFYSPNVCFETSKNDDLIIDFNYEEFQSSLIEYLLDYKIDYIVRNFKTDRFNGINFLLDGTIIDTPTMTTIGSISNTKDEILKNLYSNEITSYCRNNKDCYIRNYCRMMPQIASKHICKIANILNEVHCFFKYKNGNGFL